MVLAGRPVFVAVGAAGAASLLAQVVLLREMLASAQGNELMVGLVLALWLLLTAAASALGGRISPARAGRWLSVTLTVAPLVLVSSLGLLALVTSPTGQVPSLLRLMGSAAVVLLPACALSGLAFTAGLAVLRASASAGTVYAIETLGAAVAGAAFHVLLARGAASVWVLLVGGALCSLARLSLSPRAWLAPMVVLSLAAAASPSVSHVLKAARFPDGGVLAMQPSRYGVLAVVERANQRAFFHDGELLFTTEDRMAAEARIHLPLLLHPNPRRVLLVGGGLDGGLAEARKHAPQRLDYVELDPDLVTLTRLFADHQTQRVLAAVSPIADDPRRVLERPPSEYDVIVIHVPVSQNALGARLSSRECFSDARRALAPDGILAVVTPGAEAHLDWAARQRHASLLATLSGAFPWVGVAPGDPTIAWGAAEPVDATPVLLARRMSERGLRPAHVGRAWLFDRLLPLNAEDYRRAVATALPMENRDFRPVAYAMGLLESAARISPGLARAGLFALRLSWRWWMAGALVSLAVFFLVRRRASRIRLAVAAAGGVGMAMQLVLLLAFQATMGHLYYAIGGLLASFMAGMAAGALAAGRFLDRPRVLARACAGVAATAGAATLVVASSGIAGWAAGAPLFLATALVGAATGAVFPVAAHVAGPEVVSRLYAWDLAGAAASALVVSLFAVPVLGLLPVAAFAATLAAFAAIVAFKVV